MSPVNYRVNSYSFYHITETFAINFNQKQSSLKVISPLKVVKALTCFLHLVEHWVNLSCHLKKEKAKENKTDVDTYSSTTGKFDQTII